MALFKQMWKGLILFGVLVGCSGAGNGGMGGGAAQAGGGGSSGGAAGGGSAGGGSSTGGGAAGGFRDVDVVVARFNADGGLDETFGVAGVAKMDLGTASATVNRDSLWALAKDSTDRLVLFGASKGAGARTDVDRVVARLTANGAVDTSFANQGTIRFDLQGTDDSTRGGEVDPDGKIIWSGYAVVPNGQLEDGGSRITNRAVILRLNDNGSLDPSFGDGGVSMPMPEAFAPTDGGPMGMFEAYAIGRTANGDYNFAGYGRTASTGTVDVLAGRISSLGALDTSWNMNRGYFSFDLIGGDERARNLVVLNDGRTLIVGSGAPTNLKSIDAMVLMLKNNGQMDTSFNPTQGYRLFDFAGSDEAFFGAAVSPNGRQFAAAGYSGLGMEGKDDATLFLMPLEVGAPAEKAQKVPLSPSANDRFWTVTYDLENRPVAAGFINIDGDTRLAVARFNADGTLDTTFGGTGVVHLNVAVGASTLETARAVVVQSTGKIVVAGVAEH